MASNHHDLSRWYSSFTYRVREWRQRARSRAELRALDMTTGDFGFSRGTAQWEGSKPFWMD